MLALIPIVATIDTVDLQVSVQNSLPSVYDINILDESVDSGIQIYKQSLRFIEINVTVSDLNSLRDITSVKAYIVGPSVIEESPVTLENFENVSDSEGKYGGTFLIGNDNTGIYNVEFRADDGKVIINSSINFTYIDMPITRYVATTGSDAGNDCSESGSPCLTIQKGINSANEGDIVYVYDGVYDESVVITERSNIEVIGESKEGVIIQGSLAYPGILLNNSNSIKISKLTVKNKFHGLYLNNSYNNVLDNLIVYNNQNNGIFLGNSSGNNITNSNISNQLSYHGISMWLSDNNIIENVSLGSNNIFGVYMENCSNNILDNVSSVNNEQGARIRFSSDNEIRNSNITGNEYGIVYYDDNDRTNNNIVSSSIFRNQFCDIAIESGICRIDNTPPATVNDLVASPGNENGEIDLSWTAPGGNWNYGSVSSYVVKYASTPVNDSNWDSVTTYAPDPTWENLASAGNIEERTVSGFTQGDTFWVALKALDDSQESNVSNSDSSISPTHLISVVGVSCVNARSGLACNSTTNTNYLYNTLNVSGSINNSGNIDETKTIYLKRDMGGLTNVDSKSQFLPKDKTTEVSGLNYYVNDLFDEDSFALELWADSSHKDVDNLKVWSIKDHTNLSWYRDTQYPKPIETPPGNSFLVAVNLKNNNTLTHYYRYPIKININSTFSISEITYAAGNQYCECIDGNKTCYCELAAGTTSKLFYWTVNGLDVGSYSISVEAGDDLNDSPKKRERNITVQ